jgi:FkbM family methyltransferase
MNRGLIFDIGMHIGQDTAFYLDLGYWVVAVDANPVLVDAACGRFESAIASGRLVVVNTGVGDIKGDLTFYLNKAHSEWSSFDNAIGTSRGEYLEKTIPVLPLSDLMVRFGTPYYCKIDIEGFDYKAVASIASLQDRPQYISVENGHRAVIEELSGQGYSRFKFVDQSKIHLGTHSCRTLDGDCLQYQFPRGASGPFADDAFGGWLSRDEVIALSDRHWNTPNLDASVHGWFDLHASRD